MAFGKPPSKWFPANQKVFEHRQTLRPSTPHGISPLVSFLKGIFPKRSCYSQIIPLHHNIHTSSILRTPSFSPRQASLAERTTEHSDPVVSCHTTDHISELLEEFPQNRICHHRLTFTRLQDEIEKKGNHMNERNLLLLRKLPLSRCSSRISYRQDAVKFTEALATPPRYLKWLTSLLLPGREWFHASGCNCLLIGLW